MQEDKYKPNSGTNQLTSGECQHFKKCPSNTYFIFDPINFLLKKINVEKRESKENEQNNVLNFPLVSIVYFDFLILV